MTGVVHALLGSALGSLFGSRPAAFAAGMASHALGDVLPHRELPVAADGALTSALLALLVYRFGLGSPEVLGALGGISPDIEHIPTLAGLKGEEGKFYPTHGGPLHLEHGDDPEHDGAQLVIALAAAAILLRPRRGRQDAEG
ncbi:MAG TPA: hypothetical protein VGN26_01080 [Armatimonadota bacterium]|jgi:hypothetical protein